MRPQIALFSLIGLVAAGCPNSGGGGSGGGSTTTATGSSAFGSLGNNVNPNSATNASGASSASGTSASADQQCQVFDGNPHDLAVCQGCAQTLCPCASPDPSNPNVCLVNNVANCTLNLNDLVECVHTADENSGQNGSCIGLTCGAGQTADFTTCQCENSSPTTSIGPPPGEEDTTTPYLEPGFTVADRFCSPSAYSSAPVGSATGSSAVMSDDCLQDIPVGPTGPMPPGACTLPNTCGPNPGSPPVYQPMPPANVYTDVGYLRWDLGLDASQYGPGTTLQYGKPFLGSWSTFPISLSLYYELKPNTNLANTSVTINDCVEHFSGFTNPSGQNTGISTIADCLNTVGTSGVGASGPSGVLLPNTSGQLTNAITVNYISANGMAANPSVLHYGSTGNAAFITGFGLDKLVPPNDSPAGEPSDNMGPTGALSGTGPTGTGLFSNIGYYKYTWGPLTVERPPNPLVPGQLVDIASGTVSDRIAINMNLGFTPASLVESTAMSPLAATSSITTRDCTVQSNPFPCVVSGVYRSPGGGVLSQSFSPQFTANHNASTVMALPAGIVAVSTPKIVEDISQLDETDAHSHIPARLRTFVRADDGNIYMSLFQSGTWNPWLNLGRPWLCDTENSNSSGLTCGGLRNQPTSQGGMLPVYAPWAVSALATPNYGFRGGTNDGLSIASEPVVASWMASNTVYGNMGGNYNGAGLQIMDIALSNTAKGTNALGTGTMTITFFEDPTQVPINQLTMGGGGLGQYVYLDGFQMPAGTSGASSAQSTIVNGQALQLINAIVGSSGGSGICPTRALISKFTVPPPPAGTPTAFCSIDLNVAALNLQPLNGSTGLTNTAKITKLPVTPGSTFTTPYFNAGMIAVFVRVSQINSTDGSQGTFHNTVWYTMSKTVNSQMVTGKPWDFDNPANWTQWQPIEDTSSPNPQYFRTQGNPVAFIDNETIFVGGTAAGQGCTAGSSPGYSCVGAMHAPIAPEYTAAGASGTACSTTSGIGVCMWPAWYNYGTQLAWTSLYTNSNMSPNLYTAPFTPSGSVPNASAIWSTPNTNGFDTRAWPGPAFATSFYPNDPADVTHFQWAPTQYESFSSPYYISAITSDWTWAPTNQMNGIFPQNSRFPSGKNVYRLMAMGLNNTEFPCEELEQGIGSGEHPESLVSPCKYEKAMVWAEVEAPSPTTRSTSKFQFNFSSGSPMPQSGTGPFNPGYYYADPSWGSGPTAGPTPLGQGPGSSTAPGASGSILGASGGDMLAPFVMNFVGTPQAINMYPYLANANTVQLDQGAADPMQGHSMLIFGRAVCPDQTRCDPVDPQVAFLAVDSFPHSSQSNGTSTVNSTMYFGGEAFSSCGPSGGAGNAPLCAPPQLLNRSSVTTMSAFTATADVVPLFSHELYFQHVDLPLFFVTRDSNGNIASGYWQGMTIPEPTGGTGVSGIKAFATFTTGAFAN